MFALKYKNEFIDLVPGQSLEAQRNNPLFVLEDLFAEYSTPIAIKYSEKNVRLLGYTFFDMTIKQKIKIDVELYDHGSFRDNALLVIDKTNSNRRYAGKGDISGFLLFGLSILFSKLRAKKANTLLLGGDRVFNYTTPYALDGTNGYIQHFKDTENGTYDYIIAPVRNEAEKSGWMNYFFITSDINITRAFIFPRVKYVLEQIFIEHGYLLDTSLMAGTDWEKLFLFSLTPLLFLDVAYAEGSFAGDTYTYVTSIAYKPSVTIKLGKCISKELTVSELLLQICKKYGWALIPMKGNIIRLFPLKSTATNLKDFTKYAAAQVVSDYSQDGIIMAFKNSFPNSESNSTAVDLDGYTLETPVLDRFSLPATTGNYDNSLQYVFEENKWNKIDLDADNNQRIWVEHANNIGNYEPTNNNASIDCDVTTLPMYWTNYITVDGVAYHGYFPLCNMPADKEFGIRTLFYLGMAKTAISGGIYKYPLLSSVNVLEGNVVLQWSNVYKHDHPNGVDKYGIVDYWFSKWLKKTSITCADEQILYLPFNELKNLAWNDEINIFNIPYFIKSFIDPIPYRGFIKATLQRIAQAATDTTIVANTIYLKFAWEEAQAAADQYVFGTLIWDNVIEAKPIIRAYSDAAATIPFNTNNLTVLLSLTILDEAGANVYGVTQLYNFVMNGTSANLATLTLTTEDSGGTDLPPTGTDYAFKQWHPVLLPSTVRYNDVRTLRTSADYVIIP